MTIQKAKYFNNIPIKEFIESLITYEMIYDAHEEEKDDLLNIKTNIILKFKEIAQVKTWIIIIKIWNLVKRFKEFIKRNNINKKKIKIKIELKKI